MKGPKNFSLFVILLLTVVTGCSATEKRLQETKLNTYFTTSSDTTWEDYIVNTKKIIGKTRVDLTDTNRTRIIELNSPYVLKPATGPGADGKYSKGILLTHGLSDGPYFLRHVAEHFRKKGFLVFGLLLPGHGTVPGDLREVNRSEWKKSVAYGMGRLRLRAKNVYMGGFSLGCALSVNYALQHNNVAGLFLFSPAMKINSSMAWLAPAVAAVKTWEDIQSDIDYTKYQSFTFNGAAQTYKMIQENDALMEKKKKRLTIPVFAVQSIEDTTVDANRSIEVFNKYFTSVKNRFLLYTPVPKKDYDGEKTYLITKMSHLPKQKIAGFSHVGITIPAEDSHYGQKGDYRYCHHYKKMSPERKLCRTGKNIWMGETTEENLKNHPAMARLTYNPYFKELLQQIDLFLKK